MQPIPSQRIPSGDAEIAYWALGDGPPVVLLHPFPANHEFWLPVAEPLSTRYRLLLPDLRGHGDSGVGEGPATMEKHAADLTPKAGAHEASAGQRGSYANAAVGANGGIILNHFSAVVAIHSLALTKQYAIVDRKVPYSR